MPGGPPPAKGAVSPNIFAKPGGPSTSPALEKFEDRAVNNAQALLEKGILSKCQYGVKILGSGMIDRGAFPGFRPSRPREGEKIVAALAESMR